MSRLACHVKKIKGGFVGLQKHNEREFKKSINMDIDRTKTSKNFDALDPNFKNQKIDYTEKVKKIIEENYTSKRKIRQDTVRLVSVVVTSDNEFFQNLSEEETKEFFRTAAEHLADRYGEKNVVSAKVHLDERTPHMHFSFVPITEDGRLCAKEIITPQSLRSLQDELPLVLQEKGFKIDRGIENSKNQHIEPKELKRRNRITEYRLKKLKQELPEVEQAEKEKKSRFFGLKTEETGNIVLPVETYEKLLEIRDNHEHMLMFATAEKKKFEDEIAKKQTDLDDYFDKMSNEFNEFVTQEEEKLRAEKARLQAQDEELKTKTKDLEDYRINLENHKKTLENYKLKLEKIHAQDIDTLKIITQTNAEKEKLKEQYESKIESLEYTHQREVNSYSEKLEQAIVQAELIQRQIESIEQQHEKEIETIKNEFIQKQNQILELHAKEIKALEEIITKKDHYLGQFKNKNLELYEHIVEGKKLKPKLEISKPKTESRGITFSR